MTPIDALRMLARGKRPEDAILPSCRLEGSGTEAYGEEAVVNHFRQIPFDGTEAAGCLASSGHVALFAGDSALVADTHEGRILRIWRLGPGVPCPAEPSIGVAFDTDLYQARRDVMLRREDHPQLDPAAFETVREIGYDIAHGWSGDDGISNWRTRPFLLRAFSDGTTGVALFAVHRLGSGHVRSTGFFFAAARFAFGLDKTVEPQIVRDRAGEKATEQAPWRTNFA